MSCVWVEAQNEHPDDAAVAVAEGGGGDEEHGHDAEGGVFGDGVPADGGADPVLVGVVRASDVQGAGEGVLGEVQEPGV